MKNLFILFILFALPTFNYGQDKYIPFIGQNKYWIYSQQDNWEPAPNTIGGFIFTFGSDTIINGITYSKLIKYGLDGESSCPNRPCFTPYIPYRINTNFQEAFAYLREDTLSRKVFCIPAINFDNFCDTTEHVLYDFNQNVGDTLSNCNMLIHSGYPISDRYFKIDSINTELIYNKLRRVFYFEGFTYGGLPYTRNLKQIEGLGLENNLGFYIDHTVTFGSFCEGTLEQCNIISTTKDERDTNSDKIAIYPNPASDYIKLQTSKALSKIEIMDQNGTVVLNDQALEINVGSLQPGIYFVKCLSNESVSYFSKFVKL